jgi:Family of unknown function (DUF6520)
MKRIKWTIMTLAIVLSVGSAFTTRLYSDTRAQSNLYYWNGNTYMPAGQFGVNYFCQTSSSICTYSRSGNTYTPYQTLSTYSPLSAVKNDPPKKKDK